PAEFAKYVSYRAHGQNLQSSKSFAHQLMAVRSFDGSQTFPHLNPRETFILSGVADGVVGQSHAQDLQDLLPHATHQSLEGVGHMLNIKRPALLEDWFKGKRLPLN